MIISLAVVLFLCSGSVLFADTGPSLWITADIEGYLVGCDCPSGDSAGLSALDTLLRGRMDPTDVLVDLGGFRESGRSDALLEGYMDEAAVSLGYTALLAVSSDLRDHRRDIRRREQLLPVIRAGGFVDRRMLARWFGRHDSAEITYGETTLRLVMWFGEAERVKMREGLGKRVRFPVPDDVVADFTGSDSDPSILVIRGGLPDWNVFAEDLSTESANDGLRPDLIVFTGPESPAAALAGGGVNGRFTIGSQAITWISLAPRGNGLARVAWDADRKPSVEILTLERGVSPESDRILRLGDEYMDRLVEAALAASGRTRATVDIPGLDAAYWYPFGCRECEDFLWNDVPEMESRIGNRVAIREYNTANPDDFDLLLDELDVRDIELTGVPVMIVAGRVFQGDREIKEGLEAVLAGTGSPEPVENSSRSNARWEPGAVFVAGLLDGVNPCAFSAMVFLVSALAVAGRSRRTMLAIGMAYAAGIFITYGAIGAGLLGGLRHFAVETRMRDVLDAILAGLLLILAVLSTVDGVRLSRGRTDLLLKLPDNLSKRVHGVIRNSIRSGAAVGGSFLLGAVVALIELGCTGQVYLPTIAWMISRRDGGTPWLWLLIYNGAFIIPLLAVFVVSYRGVSAAMMAKAFQKRGSLVKYATAGLFAVLSLVVLLA